MERFLWKVETVFYEGDAGNKKIMLQLSLILCMPVVQADINCAESPMDVSHEQLRYFYIQRGHLHGAARSQVGHCLCWTLV